MIVNYRHIGNIKGGIFLVGTILITGLFYYSNFLSRELQEDNRDVVKLYAEIIANAINDDSNSNIDFIFENIIKKIKFPIIQSDMEKKPQLWTNLPDEIATEAQILSFVKLMDENNLPIPLVYSSEDSNPITFGYLHYGDSSLIKKIKIWTYVEIISVLLFIFLGFVGFSFIRNSEKQNIWVALSRETAHQLGTPVSALIGWLEYLKNEKKDITNVLPEIESDIDRLQQVSRRFSKMGSTPEVEIFNLSNRVNSILDYLGKRMPTLGGKVELVNKIDNDIRIKANGTLISWAVENLIRNGIDSIYNDRGQVVVDLKEDAYKIKIQIIDNGCGIPKKDWKNIFRPGFTTKNSGWGLGLSLCQRIVNEVHKGKIYVLESRPNNGTTIEVAIPKS